MHDQTVRLMNQGLTAVEIAEVPRLPPELADVTEEALAGLLADDSGIAPALTRGIAEGRLAVVGDTAPLHLLLSMLDEFDPAFNVVEP